MKKITQKTLNSMISKHELWLSDRSKGKRFDASNADLRKVVLQGVNLKEANLEDANLTEANLEDTNLTEANLEGVRAHYTNMRRANLKNASMYFADLSKSILRDANLTSANLQESDLDESRIEYANLEGANLESANLMNAYLLDANLKGANLRYTDLRLANLKGVNLTGANLEGANLEGTNLEGTNLEGANVKDTILIKESVKAYGRSRKVVRELQGVTHEMKLSAFKKAFPNAFEAIKHDIKSGTLSPESAQALIDRYGMTWQVSHTVWKGIQKLSPEKNDVIRLNIDISLITDDKSMIDTLEAIRKTSYKGNHPVHFKGPFTIGWIRYSSFESAILVEETQSDLPIVRKGTSLEEFMKRLKESNQSEEKIKEALDLLQPYVDRFYFDSLSIIFDIAHSAGLSVEMLSYEQKEEYGSPRSIYEELPKKMGMKKGTSSLDFIKGSVWKISPNPVRMGRLVVPSTWRRK